MNVNRMPATAGVVLGLLVVGSVAGVPVFAAAVLDMAGSSQLKINLNGGSLTGRVRGVGNIRYTGDVGSVDLDTVALVKVSRK